VNHFPAAGFIYFASLLAAPQQFILETDLEKEASHARVNGIRFSSTIAMCSTYTVFCEICENITSIGPFRWRYRLTTTIKCLGQGGSYAIPIWSTVQYAAISRHSCETIVFSEIYRDHLPSHIEYAPRSDALTGKQNRNLIERVVVVLDTLHRNRYALCCHFPSHFQPIWLHR